MKINKWKLLLIFFGFGVIFIIITYTESSFFTNQLLFILYCVVIPYLIYTMDILEKGEERARNRRIIPFFITLAIIMIIMMFFI